MRGSLGLLMCLFMDVEGAAQEGAPEDQKKKKAKATQAPAKEEVVTIRAESPLNPPDVFDSKQSTDVLDRTTIQERLQARTLPEALEETPGVGVQKSGPGQGSPFIRGFTGFRNVMLIDGIRLNNSTFREGPNQYWSTVDSYLADKMDVIRGPSSVPWGSDAIGGTVYVHTISPSIDEAGANFHSRTGTRYASSEQSIAARQEFSGNVDNFGWLVGGTSRTFGDIIGGKHYGLMRHTDYNEYGVDFKTLTKVDEHTTLTLAAQHYRQNGTPRWHRTIDSRSWHGSTPGTERQDDFDQARNLYYLQYRWTPKGAFVDAVTASASLQHMAEDERRVRTVGGALTREYRQFSVATPAFWLHAGKSTDWGYFTLGGEIYHDVVNSSGDNLNLVTGARTILDRGVVADNARYTMYGVFLQDDLSIGSLDITPGIRYTGVQARAEQVDPFLQDSVVVRDLDDSYSAVTGSLRFLYHVDVHWNIIAGWGMGFRAPSLDDTTSTQAALNGGQDLPSQDLEPEKTHTYDLGVRARYDSFEASVFGFYTTLNRFIQRVNVGDRTGDGLADFEKENVSKGRVYGFEVSGLYRFSDEWSLFASGGYAVGDVQQIVTQVPRTLTRAPLSKVPAPMGLIGLRFEPQGTGIWVEGLITAADHQHRVSLADRTGDTQRIPPGGTPGWTIYTLRGGYRVNPNFTVHAAIENISDKDYRFMGAGQHEPGTNFVAGFDLRF
jgi:hemoglobin/transferrin/lactoferrin receptor protein